MVCIEFDANVCMGAPDSTLVRRESWCEEPIMSILDFLLLGDVNAENIISTL